MSGTHDTATGVPARRNDGFNFTHHMAAVCRDMVDRLPELAHVHMDYVAVSFAQTRTRDRYGIHASLTPMRFRQGALVEKRRGGWYTTQRMRDRQGREMLYILCFYLPRFMDTSFDEKLTTIIHELWHISPQFDGDIRRHRGRCYAHSGSQKDYDDRMARLAAHWLKLGPPAALYRFLEFRFVELQRSHGQVYGLKVRRPQLLPVSDERAAELQRQGAARKLTDT